MRCFMIRPDFSFHTNKFQKVKGSRSMIFSKKKKKKKKKKKIKKQKKKKKEKED